MRKSLFCLIFVLLLGWQTAVYAQTPATITITTITQPTGGVEAGEEIGINITYEVGGEQPIAADAQYIIDVDLLDGATPPQTVASCRDLLTGIQGLQPGQDNSYTCHTAIPAAGSYTITAQILDSSSVVVASRASQEPLVVSEAANILPSGVVQIFAGLAIFSAIMLIVAVGTETVIDSVKVALGLKRKISSLDALKQLGTYLPGELADFGVAQAGQKQVATLLGEMNQAVIPVTKLPDLSAAVQAGNLTEALAVLQAMAPDSTAVSQLVQNAQTIVANLNQQLDAVEKPIAALLDGLKQGLETVQASPPLQPYLAALNLPQQMSQLDQFKTTLEGVRVDGADVTAVQHQLLQLISQLKAWGNTLRDLAAGVAKQLTGDWLKKERNQLVGQGEAAVLAGFDDSIAPLLSLFRFADPQLVAKTRTALQTSLQTAVQRTQTTTDAYLTSVANLLEAVEIRRHETQSPLRKLWRRLRGAGAAYGTAALWLVTTLFLSILLYLLRPSQPFGPDFERGALWAAVVIVVTAVSGYLIHTLKHERGGIQPDWQRWLFAKPESPTVLSYIEVLWNWLHGQTDLDPTDFSTPDSLADAVAKSLPGVDPTAFQLTPANLAQVVLLRSNQQADEEKTRLRLMRFTAMIVGGVLAYLLQIDAATLLDKALPGTATAVNQLFVIPGPMLHARWAWLPSQLNLTPGIILTGLAASAGSAFWHEQLERLQAARQLTQTAVQVAKSVGTAVGEVGDD